MKIVIALGGNMISDASNKSESFQDQQQRISESARIITDIIELGHQVVITHGNGPQVGSLLLQQQADVTGAVSLPLDILGALTQGQIGVLLQHSLMNEFKQRNIKQPVVVIPSTVLVQADDPGFQSPSKPVGPFFDQNRLQQFLDEDPDFSYIQTDKGYRRVVASPKPVDIVEGELITNIMRDHLVIAVGGGGTPAICSNGQIQMRAAVIDKDLASSLLARTIGADMLLILTNVDGVYRNFNHDNQEFIAEMSIQEAQELIESDQVHRGSMEPKIQAGINFTGGPTIITSPEFALKALDGKAGTRIIN